MRIKDIFKVETVDQDQFMVCLDSNVFSGMIQLNETAAFVINCLKEETSVDAIVDKMILEYEVDRESAKQGVEALIQQLNSINALV